METSDGIPLMSLWNDTLLSGLNAGDSEKSNTRSRCRITS
jgi:hypothetical protein